MVLSDSDRSGHPVDDCRGGVAGVAAVASYEDADALVRAHGEDFRSFGPPSARVRKWLSLLTSQSTRPRRGGDDVRQLTACTGLRPSGQADLRALGLLRRAIAALPPDVGEIHLQLASLEYIDVAATRELVMLTTRPSRSHPVLHYPPAGHAQAAPAVLSRGKETGAPGSITAGPEREGPSLALPPVKTRCRA